MKKTILFACIFGFALLGITVLCMSVSVAMITYSRGTASNWYDTLTWYGEVNNAVFWEADRNGTYIIHTVTKTAADGSPVALQKPLRPTDEYVMGGDKRDLWITVSGWDGTLASIDVVAAGTNITDGAVSQTFTFTGDGTQYFTGYYKTLSTMQITSWTGTGSIIVSIEQGKWGLVWKLSDFNEYLYTCGFACNGSAARRSYWNETNGMMVFSPRTQAATHTINAYVTIRWGELSAYGNPISGCNIIFDKADSAARTFFTNTAFKRFSEVLLYNCDFQAIRASATPNNGFLLAEHNLTMMLCNLNNGIYITSCNNSYLDRVSIGQSGLSLLGALSNPVYLNDVYLYDAHGTASRAIYLTGTNSFVGENFTIKDCDYLAYCYGLYDNVPRYLRNSKTDTLTFKWAFLPAGNNPHFYMQYGMKGVVKGNDTDAALNNAVVQIYEKNESTGFILKYTYTTGADGLIPYTWINHSLWTKSDILPSGSYTVRFNISCVGYQDYSMSMVLNEESNLSFLLMKNITCAECPPGGGYSPSYIDILNPNPANGSFGTNFLQASLGGLTNAVDVYCMNFTELTEVNLGTGTLIEFYNNVSEDWATVISSKRGQSFTINTTGYAGSSYLTSISLNLSRDDIGGIPVGNMTVNVYPTNSTGVLQYPLPGILSSGTCAINDIAITGGWITFNMTGIILHDGTKYCMLLSYDAFGGNVYSRFDSPDDGFPSWYTGGGRITYQNTVPPSWAESTIVDYQFNVTGWSLGGNISWDNTLNITWLNNESGSWIVYGKSIVVQNGTVSILNPNMTANNTQYWYNLSVEHQGYVVESPIPVTFTTGNPKQTALLSSQNMVTTYMAGGGCIGLPFLMFLKWRKRKKG